MNFFTDSTQVKFTALDHLFNVSSVFCEFSLPFLGTVTIRWYGVIIAFGLSLAVLLGGRLAYVWKIDIYKMIDILIYGAIGGIVGARLYYVVFQWDYYSVHPEEIIRIWNGGLAIYGGLIGGLICAFIVCKVEKINVRNLLDLCGMSFLIGQGIGRWGNFANQEAFGTNTTLPWGMYSEKTNAYLTELVNAGESHLDPSAPVHPTFLYESLWCLLGFVILYIVCKKARKFSGQIFLMYGVWYGIERTIVEGLRTDSLYIGNTNIRTSQLLSVILVVVCAVLLVVFLIKYTNSPQPIEGVDYFNEIPLYRFKRKASDAKKEEEKLLASAEKAEANGNTKKAEMLRKKAEKQHELFEKNTALAEEDDKKRAAKKAAQ
ncbi:MAG: prolipoprotein diacylglyceryl transferase [Oscillospiraceae bacterium]|nr:prolipoprotein diacylglyceryl transferase [Oscillospiraceae bacterium]